MGIIYYGVCHTCKEKIDLDKFYSWSAYNCGDYADIDKENLTEYFNEGFVYRSLRLHFFISRHNGHQLAVLTEDALTDEIDEGYKEVFPWPKQGRDLTDQIDFTDPKAGRLIIKTQLGEIYLDVRQDGINCFRFIDGKRFDTLLLPEKKDTPR